MFSALQHVCRRARDYDASDKDKAREFFETNFRPLRITTLGEAAGFLTGYYEPIVEGSRTWSQEFQVPVYRKPSNLIPGGRRRITDGFPNKGPVGRKFGRKKIVPYYDRAEIEEGVLTGRGLEICWLKNPIDLLFIQIQGSARIRMPDDSIVRINYDAHNGYPYTPVGRPLIEMGAIPREEMSMDRIRKWMEENPDVAKDVRRKNRSYVFFREPAISATEEPKGAQGVSLTPGPLHRGGPRAAHLRHAFLYRSRIADRQRATDNQIPPPDGGAGHRLRHRRSGTRRPLFRRRPGGGADRRPHPPSGPLRHAGPEGTRACR